MSEVPAIARAMADAVMEGDLAAARGLADWLTEHGPEASCPLALYVHDDGRVPAQLMMVSAPASLDRAEVVDALKFGDPDECTVATALAPRLLAPLWDLFSLATYIERGVSLGAAEEYGARLSRAVALHLKEEWGPGKPLVAGTRWRIVREAVLRGARLA